VLGRTGSSALIGTEAFYVEIEVHASGRGEQQFISIVGLPDAAVRESRDRIRAGLQSCGLPQPRGEAVVNLAPADLKKEGGAFDLGIALAMLACQNVLPPQKLAAALVLGELALDGKVRGVRGALPAALLAATNPGVEMLIVPRSNAMEAALGAGDKPVFPVDSLPEAVDFLKNGGGIAPVKAKIEDYYARMPENEPDFSEVKGQYAARRAMEIAAAGGHNSLMIGPPGTGKSMIARRVAGILPPMSLAEVLETSRIHSAVGLLNDGKPLLNRRPFRSPHHTISDAGLIGGRQTPMPGEISLAHNGVLFLDELPEFKRNVLEVLRQPLETGEITIARAAGSCTFPARFMLIAAMNPCPCGMGDPALGCRCKPDERKRYLRKLSGPLLDRIDLHVEVLRLSDAELTAAPSGESSSVIRARVVAAREIQARRFDGTQLYCNAHMTGRELQKYCVIGTSAVALLRQAIERFKLSPRAYDRILRVARTIADLAGDDRISDRHLFEAISYRRGFDEFSAGL